MKHRKLRIACSVAWGIMAVLLVVLCVRSYWRCDVFRWDSYDAQAERGVLYLIKTEAPPGFVPEKVASGWIVTDLDEIDDMGSLANMMTTSTRRQRIVETMEAPGMRVVAIKMHALLLLSIGVAIIPAVPWKRFSLRTLLIAMTLIAVGLGIVIWLTR